MLRRLEGRRSLVVGELTRLSAGRWTLQRLRLLERCEENALRLRGDLDRLDADVGEQEARLKRMEADPAVEVRDFHF